MFVSHFENKLQQASQVKSQGNQEFKAQRYSQAKTSYNKALALVQPYLFHGATELQRGKALELRASLFFNIGLCSYNSKYWSDAQTSFTQAIALNPYYMKAFCKRALAKYELGQYQQALKDIRQALQLDKQQNKQVKDAYQKIMLKHYQPKISQLKQQNQNKPNEKPKQNKLKQVKEEVKDNKIKPKDSSLLWKFIGVASIIGIGVYLINKNSAK